MIDRLGSEASLTPYRSYHGKLATELKPIVGNKEIKKVVMKNCSLTNEDMVDFVAVAKTLPEVAEIDLSHNSLGGVQNPVLLRFSELPKLRILKLQDNHIYLSEAERIIDKMKETKRAVDLELDLNSNQFSLEGLQQLTLKALNSKIVLTLPKFYPEYEKLEAKDADLSGLKLESMLTRLNVHPIRTLKLANCKLGDDEIKALCQKLALSQIFYLEHIDFSENQFGPVGCAAIAELISQCRNLKDVNLTKNKLDTKGMAALAPGVKASRSITKLNLANTQLNLEGFDIVRKAIEGHPTLIASGIDLTRNVGDPVDVVIENRNLREDLLTVIRPLSMFPVRKLTLSKCEIGDNEIKALVETMERNQLPYLEEVILPDNQISDSGFELLSQFARKCPRLRVMNLAGNQIALNGSAVLAKLGCFESLANLDLSRNRIEDRGASAIAVKISSSFAMRKLNLRGNKISASEIVKLILAAGEKEIGLSDNLPIFHLNWVNSGLTDEGVNKIARMFIAEKLGSEVEEIDFSRNQITDAGLKALSEMAKHCPKLGKIKIEKNITKKEVEWVAMTVAATESTKRVVEEKKGAGVSQAPGLFGKRENLVFERIENYFGKPGEAKQNVTKQNVEKQSSLALNRRAADS